MSLLSYTEICSLLDNGVVQGADYSAVNSASLDIHLGNVFLIENQHISQGPESILYLNKKSALGVERVEAEQLVLAPGQCVLASSVEIFNLPTHLSAEYKLKSSMARIFLEHLNAGWCDAGWTGSALTLELKNVSQHHRIVLTAGDRIGQMIFFEHTPVPVDKSYSVRGSYNNDKQVQGVKTK